jgi:autotransporter-associated beta strand protein
MKALPSTALLAGVLSFAAFNAHAQVTWDGGAGTINWADSANWNPDTAIGSGTSVRLDSNAPAIINLQNASRSVGNLTFAANATTPITLNQTTTAGLISLANGNSINVESGSANHSIVRVSTTRQTTVNVGGTAVLTHTFQILSSDLSGSNQNVFTKSGTGTLQLNGVQNNGELRGLISVTNGTLDIRGNLGVAGTGSAQNHTQLLSGNSGAILTNGGGSAVTLAFGRNSGRTTADAADQTFAGNITGNINFQLGHTSTVAGAQSTNFTGNQTLSGNNTYTGTTVVNQGTLIISGTSSGQGNYTVRGTTGGATAKTGTLIGTGTVGLSSSSNFTVGSASQIAGSRGLLEVGTATADSIGSLTIGTSGNANTLSFTNNSTVEFDFNNTLNDQITVVGALAIGATDTRLSLDSLSFTSGLASYTLMTYSSISGTFSSVFLDGSDITSTALSGFLIGTDPEEYRLVYGSTALTLEVIPEPSVAALLMGAGALAMVLRRRRRVA